PRRRRTIVEDVAEVAAAAAAQDLRAHGEEAPVLLFAHRFRRERGIEARPARAGIELRQRGEERLAATSAGVRALRLVVPVLAGERPLGALLAKDVELLGSEPLSPLGLAELDLLDLHRNLPLGRAGRGRLDGRSARRARTVLD